MIEIKKPKLPSEEVLQFIEKKWKIVISRNGYASRGRYNCNHKEGKNDWIFHANNGKGDGSNTTIARIKDVNYVVLPFGGEVAEPIIFTIPVRKRE